MIRVKPSADADRYKWVALVNATMGMLLATIDISIILISMPDISRESAWTLSFQS